MARIAFPTGILGAALLAAGCAELLPNTASEVRSSWKSFDEARATVESIVPEQTTKADLTRLGIDLYGSPNVQLLTFSDIALRFPLHLATPQLDPGLRRCFEAGKSCTGYFLNLRETRRDRVGNFWVDAFGFKRTIDVTGWSFNAVILLVDDRVVYTLYGGQPMVHEVEVTRQPLGPLQGFGESMGNLVK